MKTAIGIGCMIGAAISFPALARDIRVADQAAFNDAVKIARPGDTIVLADGIWRDFRMLFEGRGTAARPITLTAQTPGRVILSGASNLRIAGEHLVVRGLVFRDGASPTKEVIAFRRDAKSVASNVRLTDVVIDRFNQPDRRAEDIWVAIYGADNRVDHGWFAGKGNAGVTLAVIRPKGQPQDNRARIDHNYFGPRPPLGSNGGETIRIGTSDESLSDSKTIVERNYFDRCDGEVEIVSVKSGGNIIRENTIFQSQGSIVLRHGNGNRVSRNVILAGGKASTGGIRIINADQAVRDNYIEGTRGTDFTAAIAVMNGVPNSAVNRYTQVSNAVIARNSIIDPARIVFGAGNDAERTASPVSSRFAGNLIVAAKDPFRGEGDVSGIALAGNIVDFAPAMAGTTRRAIRLTRAANGLLYPAGIDAGAPRDLKPVTRAEVGPAWYAKMAVAVGFGRGRTHLVRPGDLARASATAGAGDTLRLSAGDYAMSAPIALSVPLTIAGPATARVVFKAQELFRLAEGGSLRLEGMTISGQGAVVRSAPGSTIANYAVEIVGTMFRNLTGDVIATTPATLADHVTIARASFADVSGTVVAAAAETTKLGHYPIERIAIADSSFANVGRIADVARLGTDESTFGPSFAMAGSSVSGGGTPAIRLSGVQSATIAGNRFASAGGIVIDHSVGAPDTAITGNRFTATPAPTIAKLYPQGTPRVTLRDNIGLAQ
ncbi:MAG: polysaccharide lyase 6 family protein [Pseudomonadota bacterium]